MAFLLLIVQILSVKGLTKLLAAWQCCFWPSPIQDLAFHKRLCRRHLLSCRRSSVGSLVAPDVGGAPVRLRPRRRNEFGSDPYPRRDAGFDNGSAARARATYSATKVAKVCHTCIGRLAGGCASDHDHLEMRSASATRNGPAST
jgi:hypothetical protein